MRLQGMHAQSFPADALQMLRGRFAAGHGTLSFVDYVKEFPYFREESFLGWSGWATTAQSKVTPLGARPSRFGKGKAPEMSHANGAGSQ
jgi:hypothetical protein